jgi:hypothetical protein
MAFCGLQGKYESSFNAAQQQQKRSDCDTAFHDSVFLSLNEYDEDRVRYKGRCLPFHSRDTVPK